MWKSFWLVLVMAFVTFRVRSYELASLEVSEEYLRFLQDNNTNVTDTPTGAPTSSPTVNPTESPTAAPTTSPTANPTGGPTTSPTDNPTKSPTTQNPTSSPTQNPTRNPTFTQKPTDSPTVSPTRNPTSSPTQSPTQNPTTSPTQNPTGNPTQSPTANPTQNPTFTQKPTQNPTSFPTASPTKSPTKFPTTPFPTVAAPADGGIDAESVFVVLGIVGFVLFLGVVGYFVITTFAFKATDDGTLSNPNNYNPGQGGKPIVMAAAVQSNRDSMSTIYSRDRWSTVSGGEDVTKIEAKEGKDDNLMALLRDKRHEHNVRRAENPKAKRLTLPTVKRQVNDPKSMKEMDSEHNEESEV